MILQSEEFVQCPYCGERVSILLDHSIPSQSYVEDCEVCCRPIDIECDVNAGRVSVSVSRADD